MEITVFGLFVTFSVINGILTGLNEYKGRPFIEKQLIVNTIWYEGDLGIINTRIR